MDEGEPMWSKDDLGNYCLMFPNKYALSKNEIKEIFSEFGKVKNVNTAGDEKGYRFVQYTSLEDVERAVENIKGHPKIKLLPHRPKKKNKSNDASKNETNNSSPKEKELVTNNAKRNFYQRPLKRDSITNINESISSNENQFQKVVNTDQSNFIHETKNSSYQQHVPDNISVCSSYLESRKAASIASVNSPIKKAIELLKLRGTNANSFSPSGPSNNVISDTDIDKIPDLVTIDQIISPKEPKKLIFNAEEIIVANIHSNYGSAYILHLFEQFEPLAVSYIKVLPKTETRYCHVYFKTAQESVGVEKQFDKYDLSGKKLVVLRPHTLMEEAMS